MHVPTLPSLPSWETPVAASREIAGAIGDVADSAVDAAASAVRSARRRRRGTSRMLPKMVWFALAAVALAGIALVRARRSNVPAVGTPAAQADRDAAKGPSVDVDDRPAASESAGIKTDQVRAAVAD